MRAQTWPGYGELEPAVPARQPTSSRPWRTCSPRPLRTSVTIARDAAVRWTCRVSTDESGAGGATADRERGAVLASCRILREGGLIGTISMYREHAGAVALRRQIEHLLQTFADQAVIAVENARLLTELQQRARPSYQRSVGQLTALGEVGQAVSSSLDLETVLTTIVSRAVELSGLDGGVVFEYDEAAEEFEQRASTGQEARSPRRAGARASARARAWSGGRPSPTSRSRCPTSRARAPTRAGCARAWSSPGCGRCWRCPCCGRAT